MSIIIGGCDKLLINNNLSQHVRVFLEDGYIRYIRGTGTNGGEILPDSYGKNFGLPRKEDDVKRFQS